MAVRPRTARGEERCWEDGEPSLSVSSRWSASHASRRPPVVGAPTRERIEVDETFVDSVTCTFPVMVHSVGHVTIREYDRAKGVVSLQTLNIKSIGTANGKSVVVHDVGSDQLRIAPDGTVILSIRGQIPFGPSEHRLQRRAQDQLRDR